MKKFLVIYLLCFSNNLLSQSKLDSVYNNFTSNYDTLVWYIGNTEIIPFGRSINSTLYRKFDSITLIESIYLDNNLLFKFNFENGIVNGMGYCYYPLLGRVAIQAQFKNSKLNGFVYVNDVNGVIIEILKYKNGKYKKHIYFKNLGKLSRKLVKSKNPLKGDFPLIR